ncbi:MAG: hypothetical protein VB855_15035, partial [Pirellulaceae bacterium]
MELDNDPRSRTLLRGGTAVLTAVFLLGFATPAAAEAALSCKRIPELIVHYLQKHIRFHYPNDELRQRVVDSYMRKLDPAKTLYLRSDARRLEKALQGVLLDLNDGDCKVLNEIHEDLPKRYAAWEDFVRQYVSQEEYAIDSSATLVLDAEKRPRPSTRQEQQALYAKLIHFQMANYIVALTEEETARKRSEAEESKTPTPEDSSPDTEKRDSTASESAEQTDPPRDAPGTELEEITVTVEVETETGEEAVESELIEATP